MRKYLKYLLILLLIPFLMAISLRITNEGGGNSISVVNTISDSLTFDGVDDFVDCGNDISLKMPTNDFTISAWVNYRNASWRVIFSTRAWDAGYYVSIKNTNDMQIRMYGGGLDLTNTFSAPVAIGIWKHLVWVIDRDVDVKVYIDGQYIDNVALPSIGDLTNTITNKIGSSENNVGALEYLFTSQLADVRIYNRDLSPAEITRVYRGDIITDGLVAHWPLQEGGLSEKAYDVSGNDNYGDLTNFTLSDGWKNVQNKSLYPQYMGYEVYTDDATGLIEIKVPYKVDGGKITPTITGYTKQSEHSGRGYNKSLLRISEYYRGPGLLKAA